MDPKPSISKHFSNISSIYPEKISTWKNKVFLSFDIDWAHDEVLKDTILNGETRIGLCIHRMIGGELDSGDIIARDYLNIDETTKVTRAWEWLNERIPALFLDAIKSLSIDQDYILEKQSKQTSDAHRCYPRRPEDGRIDWQQSALRILRLINASNKPYAGAFCDYEGLHFVIWTAEIVNDYENFSAVGADLNF